MNSPNGNSKKPTRRQIYASLTDDEVRQLSEIKKRGIAKEWFVREAILEKLERESQKQEAHS